MTTAEFTIDSIAAGGDGIGRANGVVVFVPRTAPGRRASRPARREQAIRARRLESIVVPSPRACEPPCYHYRMDRCGGCQLQHMQYDAQLDAKRGIIRDSITRIGSASDRAAEIEPSDEQWRYRRKLTLAMRRGRAGSGSIGLHPYDDPVAVFRARGLPDHRRARHRRSGAR